MANQRPEFRYLLAPVLGSPVGRKFLPEDLREPQNRTCLLLGTHHLLPTFVFIGVCFVPLWARYRLPRVNGIGPVLAL